MRALNVVVLGRSPDSNTCLHIQDRGAEQPPQEDFLLTNLRVA